MTTFKYIGQKDEERAFEAESGIVWLPNSEHGIKNAALAEKMRLHTGVWQVVEKTQQPGLSDSQALAQNTNTVVVGQNDLATMDKAELHTLAKTLGIVVHANAGADTVRTAITTAQAAK